MNQKSRAFALLIGGALALSAFAACAPDSSDGTTEQDAASDVRICYDNLGGGYLDDSVTKASVAGVTVVAGYNAAGTRVDDASSIATYADGVFTAVSAGTVVYRTADGEFGTVEVVPAYVTDPGYQYSGGNVDFDESGGEEQLGHTHDPSLIEVQGSDGRPVYYIFSTGWNNRSESVTTGGMTYGNAIHVSYNGMKTWMYLGRTFDWETRDEDFVDTKAGRFLYSEGHTAEDQGFPSGGNGYSASDAGWWAPDIVAKPDGSGYWLYTCVVDGSEYANGRLEGLQLDGESRLYSRACILLYESETLDAGSFKPVMDENGEQYAFVQCSIPRTGESHDVNAIDPQIIFDEDGNMYMAYGSFGSGNYLLELDLATGLRKDGKTQWVTHDQIREYIEGDGGIQDLYAETSDAIGWKHEYYGTNISKQNMEAPVIARHDNVTTMDENGTVLEENKTYFYSMHSYDGLADNYQMWGGRSESVWGIYRTTTDQGIVYNVGPGNGANQGNKYMGAFTWHNKSQGNTELDIILPGHNDLFTTNSGVSVAAYITRQSGNDGNFVTQLHQYYLNSYGRDRHQSQPLRRRDRPRRDRGGAVRLYGRRKIQDGRFAQSAGYRQRQARRQHLPRRGAHAESGRREQRKHLRRLAGFGHAHRDMEDVRRRLYRVPVRNDAQGLERRGQRRNGVLRRRAPRMAGRSEQIGLHDHLSRTDGQQYAQHVHVHEQLFHDDGKRHCG